MASELLNKSQFLIKLTEENPDFHHLARLFNQVARFDIQLFANPPRFGVVKLFHTLQIPGQNLQHFERDKKNLAVCQRCRLSICFIKIYSAPYETDGACHFKGIVKPCRIRVVVCEEYRLFGVSGLEFRNEFLYKMFDFGMRVWRV
jgi:hypothetical protein